MSEKTISIGFKFEEGADGLGKIALSAAELRKVMQAAVRDASGLSSTLANFAHLTQGVQSVNSALGQVSQALGACTGDARSFADAMRSANTMAGRDAGGLSALRDQVTEIARQVPVARDALAGGLYQVISNGVPEDNWLTFLETSARSSIGGIADLGQVVGVTSTIVKNYGMDWSDAAAIQDKIQLTARSGVTSFEQLASALPRVTANAATLGVGIDELMATFATLTGVSGSTSEVSTQLAAVLNSLVKPSSEAAKTAEAMGIRFDAAAIKAAGGMQQFLVSLDKSVKTYAASSGVLEQEVYGRLFGSAEAMRALIPLNGELADTFAANIASMQSSAGTMDAAFNDMSQTGEAAAQKLRNSFAPLYDVGEKAASLVRPVLSFGVSSLTVAANVGVLCTSMGALKSAFATTWMSKAAAVFGSFMGRGALESLRFAAAANSAAIAAKGCAAAMTGMLGAGAVVAAVAALSSALSECATASKAASAAAADLNDIRIKAASAAEQERQKILELVGAAESENTTLDEKRTALSQLNEIIPQYNAALDETTGKYEANTEALNNYLDALSRKYEVEGAQDRLRQYGAQKAEIREQIEILREQKESLTPVSSSSEPAVHTTSGGGMPGGVMNLMGRSGDAAAIDAKINKLERELVSLATREDKIRGIYGKDIAASKGSQAPGMTVESSPVTASPAVSSPRVAHSAKPEKETPPEGSLAALEEQIKAKRVEVSLAVDDSSRQRLTKELDELEGREREVKARARLLIDMEEMQRALDNMAALSVTVKADIDSKQLERDLKKAAQGMDEWRRRTKKAEKDNITATEAFAQLGRSVSQAGSAIGGAEGEWVSFAGSLVSGISEMLPALAALIGGQFAEAMAAGTSSAAGIGFPQNIAAIAAVVAAIGSVMASVPKFADGGIAYGPTLGLFGEYAGAASNPEVVAPLDKLRGMIADSVPGGAGGEVVFTVEGSRLVGVLANTTRQAAKAGRRTNIRI